MVYCESDAAEGSQRPQNSNSLSDACLKRLKQAAKLFVQLEVSLASEIHTCQHIETLAEGFKKSQRLLNPKEWQQFGDFHETVERRRAVSVNDQNVEGIKECLRDTECVSNWQLVYTATSRAQNRYVVLDGSIAIWDECRNRAKVFLDLGVGIIRHLEPIKVELQQDADDILFALRVKLNTLQAYNPIYVHQLASQRKNQDATVRHPYVDLLHKFMRDDPLPAKVAEAYPETHNAV